jgi:hypothetical protein
VIPYMGCEQAHLLLDRYVDEELGIDEQVTVEAHLRWCSSCAARVDDLRVIGHSVRSESSNSLETQTDRAGEPDPATGPDLLSRESFVAAIGLIAKAPSAYGRFVVTTGLLDTWCKWLPSRIANEEVGDYHERIKLLCRENRRWSVYRCFLSAVFWSGLNGLGYALRHALNQTRGTV